MNHRKSILVFLTALTVIQAMGQGQQVLTDGIGGRDNANVMQFIQAISPQGDTCLVMTDSLGRFEIDAYLMDGMRGNVYLKPMITRPRPKLVLDSPFDSIDVYRERRGRFMAQNLVSMTENDEQVFYYDPETTLLEESVIKSKRHSIARDKVTGYLDSLAILESGEWVCDCPAGGAAGYLNNYRGYSHHPEGSPMEEGYRMRDGKRSAPKRGEIYRLIKYIPSDQVSSGWIVDMTDPPHDFEYPGPYYSEEDLLEMNGMWKTQGYYPKREFYEPDELYLASPAPDFRNQLQWLPAVLTDENGVAEIPFAASDVNTEFIGIVEAIDGTGLLGARIITFRVIKE